jgi:8-oxo-dGTP pyrophosphatase MutT (NUDIX family)
MAEHRYTAAGGVVVDGARMLVLDRSERSEVRLPKGHVEAGEDLAATAVRETQEESGYADLDVVADLGEQIVEFDLLGDHVVRTEHYFLMESLSPKPQRSSPSPPSRNSPAAPRRLTASASSSHD